MRSLLATLSLLFCIVALSGCPKKLPTQALKDARAAIDQANKELAERCAKDEINAAKKMMAKAKEYMDQGAYDKARSAFVKARALAQRAGELARQRKDECLKPKNPTPTTRAPAPPTVMAVRERPMPDTRQKLATIYFGFNQYTITARAGEILKQHANWLKRNPNAYIEVSGHCDQRGSVEYNLSLGERRALGVKRYLVDLGIPSSRISIISYGHQRLSDPRNTSEAYAKNRRAEFRITKR